LGFIIALLQDFNLAQAAIYNKAEKVLFEVDDAYDEEKIKRLFRREFFLILPNCKYFMKVII
jgi:hypothetical protein